MLADWWDAKAGQEFLQRTPEGALHLALSLCNDSFTVDKAGRLSVKPLTATLLNLQPSERIRHYHKWTLMILPRGLPRALMDNYLAPLFEEITRLSDRGVLVTDHRLAAPMAPSVRAFCSIARVVNDLRGTTDLTAGPQAPALVGACHCCDVEGVAALSTVAYLSAHRQLPVGHELRAD